MNKAVALLPFFLIAALGLSGQSPNTPLTLAPVASGFVLPVGITHAGDDRLFVVGKTGIIYLLDSARNVAPTPFLNITGRVKSSNSEKGLLGLAFHPDYAQNGYFYVYYSRQANQDSSYISRFSVSASNPQVADPNSEQVLLKFRQPFTNHNAGDLAFGPDGYLYIASGDGGSGGDPLNFSQNPQSLLGKILRIDVNAPEGYRIPTDNPFAGSASARPEIWHTGLRNPWRISFDRETGDLWMADVGQDDWEEVNLQRVGEGGGNYGWKCYEGNASFSTQNCGDPSAYRAPVHVYANQAATNGCSVTGGYVYRGQAHPALRGQYIFGDFCSGNIWRLSETAPGVFTPSAPQKLLAGGQLSSFGEDRNGELYAVNYNGSVLRIVGPAASLRDLAAPVLHIGPTPWTDQIRVESPEHPIKTVRVFDSQGKVLSVNVQQDQAQVWVLGQPPASGWYIMEITLTNGAMVRRKIIAIR